MHDETLYQHFNCHVPLSAEEFRPVAEAFTFRVLGKKETLLQPGEVCRHFTFVVQGVLRAYTVDAEGYESIMQFALENWWIGDMYSFLSREPGTYVIEAVEPAQVLQLDHAAWQHLLDTHPKYERYFRLLLQNNYVATHRRLALALSRTAEEKYDALLLALPTIMQRVPQHLVASYLGITPEFLSRIRSRRLKQPG